MKTLLALAAFALASAPASAQTQGWQKIAGQERIAGQRSAISGRGVTTIVVRTQADWEAFWERHTGAKQGAPAVDFSREMVVGVFLGERSRAGYSIECTMVLLPVDEVDPTFARKNPTLVVYYKEVPPKTTFGASVMSAPFELRKIGKYPAVTFEPDSLFKAQGRIDTLRVFKDDPRFDR